MPRSNVLHLSRRSLESRFVRKLDHRLGPCRNFGRQLLDSAHRFYCRHVPSLLLELGRQQLSQPRSIGRQRSGYFLLTRAKQRWRTTGASSSKGCRSMSSWLTPGRSTRDAVAILGNVFERFTCPGHRRKISHRKGRLKLQVGITWMVLHLTQRLLNCGARDGFCCFRTVETDCGSGCSAVP